MRATYIDSKQETGNAPRVDEIRVKWEPDDAPDLSRLEQFSPDSEDKDEREYARQDRERLSAYGES